MGILNIFKYAVASLEAYIMPECIFVPLCDVITRIISIPFKEDLFP